MLPSKLIKICSIIVDSFVINIFTFLAKTPFDSMSLHEGLIEDTSYILKPLCLLCAALGVNDKLGKRPLHLTRV